MFLKIRVLRKSSKSGHRNLVLITSTVQVELSKLNFNFDDVRTYFLQVLRDSRQITFVILNGFCLLSQKKKRTVSWWIECIYTWVSSFGATSYIYILIYIKKCKIQPLDLLHFLLFLLAFTSADTFHKFLELHLTLSEKRIFVTTFLFLTNSLNHTQTPPPPYHHSQNLLSVTKIVTKFFC